MRERLRPRAIVVLVDSVSFSEVALATLAPFAVLLEFTLIAIAPPSPAEKTSP